MQATSVILWSCCLLGATTIMVNVVAVVNVVIVVIGCCMVVVVVGGSVAVAQLTTAKLVELSWKWLSQADGSAFQTPRLGLAW